MAETSLHHSLPAAARDGDRAAPGRDDLGLFAGTVLVWSTTWLAIKFQLGSVDPQVSIVWRFAIAAPLFFLVCRVAGAPIAFPLRTHLRFAALGLLFYSTNFILFYNAGRYVVSGLLAVMFSLASLTNIALAAIFLRDPIRPRVALGALIGLAGITLLFWHELAGGAGSGPLIGLGLGILGCLSFSSGNIIPTRAKQDGIPALSTNAWGVTYGIVVNVIVALFAGSAFTIEPTARYLVSLLWLAIPGSVLAFWMYVSLLGRIGPDRAGYTAILAPVFALLLSTLVEDYRWSMLAVGGLALVAAGNVLVLTGKRS